MLFLDGDKEDKSDKNTDYHSILCKGFMGRHRSVIPISSHIFQHAAQCPQSLLVLGINNHCVGDFHSRTQISSTSA